MGAAANKLSPTSMTRVGDWPPATMPLSAGWPPQRVDHDVERSDLPAVANAILRSASNLQHNRALEAFNATIRAMRRYAEILRRDFAITVDLVGQSERHPIPRPRRPDHKNLQAEATTCRTPAARTARGSFLGQSTVCRQHLEHVVIGNKLPRSKNLALLQGAL
jgi:hypothetical protein